MPEFQFATGVKNVTSGQTKTGKTKYNIDLEDGNTYVTFDANIAQKFASLKGQPIIASTKVEQSGQYTNYYANDATPNPGGAAAIPQAGIIPQAQSIQPVVIPQAPQRDFAAEALGKVRHGQILAAQGLVGQMLLANAEAFSDASGNLDDGKIMAKVLKLAEATTYFAMNGFQEQVVATPAAPVLTTPTEVAGFANAVAGAEVVTVGAPVDTPEVAKTSDVPGWLASV